jgi:hypothetical protein
LARFMPWKQNLRKDLNSAQNRASAHLPYETIRISGGTVATMSPGQ